MRSLSGVALCFVLPFAVAASPDDAASLVQAHAALDTMQKDSDVEAMRALLAGVHTDLEARILQGLRNASTGSTAKLSDIQKKLAEATQFLKAKFGKTNKTNVTKVAHGGARSTETCEMTCKVGTALDVMALAFEQFSGTSCSVMMLLYWWVVGLTVETTDRHLDFSEAVHMMSQQITSIGYGSSTPPGDDGLKIFHGIHGILSQLSPATTTGEAVAMARRLMMQDANKVSVTASFIITLAASTYWFAMDLHKGDTTTYPEWSDALMDGFYQAMITATTIGYGDYSLATPAGKLFTPVGLPLLTGAFGAWAGGLAPSSGGGGAPAPSPKKMCI